MSPQELFTQAYLAAMDFTELGETENGQPPAGAELTALSKCRAINTCRNFYEACKEHIGSHVEQAGRDLWFTRQGHGVGFWDRPKTYGTAHASLLTKVCHAIGEDQEFDYGDRSFGSLQKGTKFLNFEGVQFTKTARTLATHSGVIGTRFPPSTTVWILED